MRPAQLGQVLVRDDPQPGRQALEKHGHDIGEQHDP